MDSLRFCVDGHWNSDRGWHDYSSISEEVHIFFTPLIFTRFFALLYSINSFSIWNFAQSPPVTFRCNWTQMHLLIDIFVIKSDLDHSSTQRVIVILSYEWKSSMCRASDLLITGPCIIPSLARQRELSERCWQRGFQVSSSLPSCKGTSFFTSSNSFLYLFICAVNHSNAILPSMRETSVQPIYFTLILHISFTFVVASDIDFQICSAFLLLFSGSFVWCSHRELHILSNLVCTSNTLPHPVDIRPKPLAFRVPSNILSITAPRWPPPKSSTLRRKAGGRGSDEALARVVELQF